ncbi:hypothetical protein GQ44DRAFT_697003 [Phaeosphaeriaceae sp. PMI808]|nr:hypothetical protein GQ44DRAFT_697003 [Phaeosphaeriaceae sp. PMI808]
MPILTKPTKKREGYGFSFTDTLFYDSDEYPDTICGANGSEIETNSLPAASSSSHPSPIVSSPLIKQNSSFAEVVVMRDIGSFNMTKPQKHLACTTASREDTLRLKVAAKALDKYAESSEVYGRLISRLENMVLGTLEVAAGNHGNSARGIMTWAAMKLQNFLTENQGGRIETGESRRLVEHEIEWVGWLVEASYTGVMHLKTEGCGCKPDWEGE